eukprot:INCI14989.5.p1 GENE.INCI14989.5~~INCI14989.5.p1  ORF type:complete len:853 (-),score=163.28 INCI14989.5:2216-4774(-)
MSSRRRKVRKGASAPAAAAHGRGRGNKRATPKVAAKDAAQEAEEEAEERNIANLEEKFLAARAAATTGRDDEVQRSDDDADDDADDESGDDSSGDDLESDPDENDEGLEGSSSEGSSEAGSDGSASEDDEEEGSTAASADRKQNSAASKEHRRFARAMHIEDLSSDEEKPKNTIGDVPLEWYNNLEHIGYDVEGKKIARRYGKSGVDAVIASKDDPNFKWTVVDERNGEQRVLSERELLLIRRMQSGRFAHSQHNPYPDYVPYYTSEKEVMPLTGAPIPKRRFTPSLHEERKVAKLVRDIKAGKITFQKKKKKDTEAYLLWTQEDDAQAKRRGPERIPAPKTAPPSHAFSYRPPPEFVPTEEEVQEWLKLPVSERPYGEFIPRRYDSLRHIPAYANFVRERFNRCLDLYMAPRVTRQRLNIDPESLVPKLPDPKELRPYPTSHALTYRGHSGLIRTISPSPTGEFLASGADDRTVRIWEVATGRCLHVFDVHDTVHCVAWNPKDSRHIVAAAVGSSVLFFNTGTGDDADAEEMETLTRGPTGEQVEGAAGVTSVEDAEGSDRDGTSKDSDAEAGSDEDSEDRDDQAQVPEEGVGKRGAVKLREQPCEWKYKKASRKAAAARAFLRINYRSNADVAHLAWHHRGDYLATACPKAVSTAVVFHILSKPGKSQCPFASVKGVVQRVQFHPSKPIFFLGTRHSVRVYNLQKAALVKKLKPNVKWLSSLDIHPSGDHVICGSYDRVVNWFDLDLSSAPYKALRYHTKGVRQTAFHSRYPLMATCSDDGNIHIFHAMVYSDLLRNPLVVPLTILRGKTSTVSGTGAALGVLDCAFHPTQPWVFGASADNNIRLFQNIH